MDTKLYEPHRDTDIEIVSNEDFRTSGLRFANTAKEGDIIRAFDFRPSADRSDQWVQGKVYRYIRKHGVLFYEVQISDASEINHRIGLMILVPAGLACGDWETRITLQSTAQPLFTHLFTIPCPSAIDIDHIDIMHSTTANTFEAIYYDKDGKIMDTALLDNLARLELPFA